MSIASILRNVLIICLSCLIASVGQAADKPVVFTQEFGHDLFAISPDGKQLALYYAGSFRIADTATGNVLRANDRFQASFHQLTWFADGKRILAVGEGIQVLDAATLKVTSNIEAPDVVWRSAISPDEKMLAVGQPNGSVLLIDLQTRQTIATLQAHTQQPNCVAFSCDGRQLLTAGGYGDRELISWVIATKKQIGTIPVSGREVNWFALSPDETQVYVLASHEKLTVHETATGREVAVLPDVDRADVVTVSPDGKTIVTSHGNDLLFRDVQGQKTEKLQGHDNGINQIEFSRDGSLLVSGGGHSVRVWKLGTSTTSPSEAYSRSGGETHSISTDDAPVQQVSLSPNGRWLAAAVDTKPVAQVYVWHADTLEPYEKLPAGSPPLLDVQFRDDNKLVFLHSKGEFVVWEAGRKKEMRRLPVTDADRGFGFSHGRNVVYAIGSGAGEILIGGAKDGEARLRFPAHDKAITRVDVTSNGGLVVSGSHDESARISDAVTGKLVATLPKLRGLRMTYHTVQFSPDDKLVAAGSDRAVILWDVEQKKVLHQLSGHDGYCRCLDFSADSKWLATGGDDRLIRIWRVSDGKPVAELAGHTDMLTGVSFSTDQKTLASGSHDKTVKLWDVSKFLGDDVAN